MNKNIFLSKQVLPDTWLIQGEGCTSYLLTGTNEGAVIDTGFSEQNIQEYVQSLTEKPISFCVNTHGHFDHTGGNGYFPKAYMSAEALKTAIIPYDSLQSKHYILSYPITVVADETIIKLAGRDLEVIEIPAHSSSSIAILDKEKRILFTGDEVGEAPLIWMTGGQPYVEDYYSNMQKLMKRSNEFDYILTGHGDRVYGKELLEDSLENARHILAGDMGEEFKLTGNEPEDFHLPEPEFKRKSFYKSSCISFDMRFICRQAQAD